MFKIRTSLLESELEKKNVQEIEIPKDPLNGLKEKVEIEVVLILEKSGSALTFREVCNKSRFSEMDVKRNLEASLLIKKTSMGKLKDFFNLRKCPFKTNPRTFLYYLEDDDIRKWVRGNYHLI